MMRIRIRRRIRRKDKMKKGDMNANRKEKQNPSILPCMPALLHNTATKICF